METDIRYYRRRACEEMCAASRAVTPEARRRRLHLVGVYLDRLKALNAPSPFDDAQFAAILKQSGSMSAGSPFCWTGERAKSETV